MPPLTLPSRLLTLLLTRVASPSEMAGWPSVSTKPDVGVTTTLLSATGPALCGKTWKSTLAACVAPSVLSVTVMLAVTTS